ncbi:MAG: serine/threonine-protein kinase [Steroidobacter sp.]
MMTDVQKRWREISQCLDEVLDLADEAREPWLQTLDVTSPEISQAVRALLAESAHLADQPLLSDEHIIPRPPGGLAGQQLGAYTLESVLGHGGMGTVWLARRSDGRYEGRVAVKLLNAALIGRPTEQRFVREGSVLAKLQHPNIAQLIDAGVAPSGQPFLVLEYVQGEHIDRYAELRGLDINQRLHLFLDVLAAVAHAHSRLIVHRDIKPSNILVTAAGVVKLLDFGIAALLGPEEQQLTREVELGLTPGYAAPEQLLKQPVTTATDVYALGTVLFLLLTGRHPLDPDGKSALEIGRATLDSDLPSPSRFARDPSLGRALRGDLDNIVAKALQKDAGERYATAEAFAQDLRFYLDHQPVSARPATVAYRAGKFLRRHRAGVIASAVTAIALIVATILTTLQMLEASRQRDAALYQSRRAEFQSRFAYQIMSEAGSDGQPLTIRSLMEKGIEVLEKNYGDDPRFVIGMLVNISGRYMNLGDTKGEYAALVKAEKLARQIADPERIAYVQCNTVETELAAGRLQQARERMSDGLAHLEKLPERLFDRETECGTAHARLLWAEGRVPEAIDEATRMARLFEAESQTGDVNYRTLITMLDVMLSLEGRRQEARLWNARYFQILEKVGDTSGVSFINARHHQAGHLHDAGESRAALEIERRAVESVANQQGVDSVRPAFSSRLGFLLVRVEETAAGFEWLDRAVAAAARVENHSAHITSLLNRARANLLLGRMERVPGDIDEAERLIRQNPSENIVPMRDSRLIRAEYLLARGAASDAIRQVDINLAEIGYPRKRVANQLASMVLLKARAELALGRNSTALATAQDALALAEANAPKPEQSATVGAALMVIARAQRAAGDEQTAIASARRASAALSKGLGENHSETRAATAFL